MSNNPIKNGIYFFRVLVVLSIISQLGVFFDIDLIHQIGLFGNDFTTQLVVLIGFHQLLTVFKEIKNELEMIKKEVNSEETN